MLRWIADGSRQKRSLLLRLDASEHGWARADVSDRAELGLVYKAQEWQGPNMDAQRPTTTSRRLEGKGPNPSKGFCQTPVWRMEWLSVE